MKQTTSLAEILLVLPLRCASAAAVSRGGLRTGVSFYSVPTLQYNVHILLLLKVRPFIWKILVWLKFLPISCFPEQLLSLCQRYSIGLFVFVLDVFQSKYFEINIVKMYNPVTTFCWKNLGLWDYKPAINNNIQQQKTQTKALPPIPPPLWCVNVKLWVELQFMPYYCSDATLKNVICGLQFIFDGLLWPSELDVSGIVFFSFRNWLS